MGRCPRWQPASGWLRHSKNSTRRSGRPIAPAFPFPHDGGFLLNLQILNLTTRLGNLDLSFRPAGTEGFSELEPRAVPMRIHDLQVAVAALEDIIRSKEAANRAKDRRSLPVLRQLLDEIRKRQQ